MLGKGGIIPQDFNDKNTLSLMQINIAMQVNIKKWFRLSPSVGYRYVSFDHLTEYKYADFSGFTYGLNFEFGFINKKNFKKMRKMRKSWKN
jgi:hypothetical protein